MSGHTVSMFKYGRFDRATAQYLSLAVSNLLYDKININYGLDDNSFTISSHGGHGQEQEYEQYL